MTIQIQNPTRIPTQKQIALAFGISDRSIRRWSKPSPLTKLGRKPKIQDRSLIILQRYILGGRHNLTQQEIANRIYEETGQKIHQSNISRMLKKKDISRKVATKQFSEQDLEKAKQFIADNYHLLSSPSLYALDECGFNLSEVSRYAYSRKGRRAIVKRPGKRGDNYTLILCVQNVAKQAVVGYKLIVPKKPDKKIKKKKGKDIKKGTKAVDLHDFLASIDFPTNRENCLLLDNAKIHHAVRVCIKAGRLPIKILATKKNVKLLYLVAYSPQLNPVELCFNFIRNYVKKCQARTEEKLKQVIEEAIALLQKEDLTQWFQHCWENFNGERKLNGRKWSYDLLKIMKVMVPWPKLGKRVYPSRRWFGMGNKLANTKEAIAKRKRVRKCVLRSLELVNWKRVKYDYRESGQYFA